MDRTERAPRLIWVGLVAAAFYVVFAAGGGLLVDAVLGPDTDPVVELALSHLIPLPLAIAAGLLFARWSGWWRDVWTDPPATRVAPRRRWMIVIPIAIAVQVILLFVQAPWASLSAAYIWVGLLCYLLVGLGEELFFRGLLLEAVRGRHGELTVLLVTALGFGLAHSVGSGIAGVPIEIIAFQVAVTAMDGVLLYGALRATGTLWVPILLHGLGDYGRWLASGDGEDHTSGGDVWVQVVLTVLSLVLLISVIRETVRARRSSVT